MNNEVSIIIRVNDSEADKLRKVAAVADQAGKTAAAASAGFKELGTAQQSTAHAAETAVAALTAETAAMRNATAAATSMAAAQRNASFARSGGGQFLTSAGGYAGLPAGMMGRAGAYGAAGLAVAAGGAGASGAALEMERLRQTLGAVTGSLEAARVELSFVDREANRLGVSVGTLGKSWGMFAAAANGTALEGEKARTVFLAVAEAAQKLNLPAEQSEGALRALGQMLSKGNVQAEELRGQLGDRLPGAFGIMARALGVSTAELDKMLKAGEVAADVALPKFADELRRTFGTDATTRIETTTSNFERLKNEIHATAAAIGGPLNSALSSMAGAAADGLRGARNLPETMRDGLSGAGRFLQPGYAFSRQYVPGYDPDYGRPTPAVDLGLGGPSNPAIDVYLSKLEREKQSLQERTALQRLYGDIARGDLEELTAGQRTMLEQGARELDQLHERAKARKDAEQAAKQLADYNERSNLQFERQAAAIEERHHEEILNAVVRRRAAEEELRTGEALTDAKRQLLELEVRAAGVGEASLKDELQKADAIERQARARKDADALHGRLLQSAVRASSRDIRSARSYSEIDEASSEARTAAEERYNTRLAELKKDKTLTQSHHDAALAAEQEFEAEKTRIALDGYEARRRLTAGYVSATQDMLANLGEVFKAQGKKGFENFKRIAVAQTIISTLESAQNSYNSLSNIPYAGPYLGAAAAAIALAAGMARVQQIRAMTYDGGREFGGPVRAGKFVEVGERNKPELYQEGGKTYLIPGNQGGNVIPARSGGGNIAIHNHAGAHVTARRLSDGDILVMIREAAGDAAAAGASMAEARVAGSIASGRGPVPAAIGGRYRVQRKANR